ncbi:MAG: phage tail protein [Firmicutes bacterium]|nr:phage tail protein [Bacillota bacterium]
MRGEWFEPESNPTILTERTSTATIVLGPDGPDISIDDWIWDTVPEGVIVWRVKSVRHVFDEETRHIELEHTIQTLDDIYLFEPDPEPEEPVTDGGETEPEEEEEEEMTAREAVEYLLSKQGVWTLGDFEYSISNPYEFQKETLLDALENVSETLEDAVWAYDFSVFPFVLHIRKRNTAVACEMRGGRNLSTMQRTVNRGSMYTRFYPIGAGGLRITGEYVSKNENVYSRRDKVETDNSKTTEDSLLAWANGRLRRHCEPEVNITISGLELSAETGEALDQLKLNRVCRCPLPEYGTTIAEKITKLQWRDRKKEPEAVTVTLCNNVEDVATILRKEKRTGTSGAAGAEQSAQNSIYHKKNDRLFYEFFDECGHLHSSLEMTAASLRIDFDNLNNSTRSELRLTAESLRVTFENGLESTRSEFMLTAESMRIQFENEITSARSDFSMTAESMRIQFENEITSARSDFSMTAESMRIYFEAADGSIRSSIQQEANRIGLIVEGYGESAELKRAAIILSINGEGGSSAHINADEVYIGNEKSTTIISGKLDANTVTAQYIQGKISDILILSANALSVAGGINGSGTLTIAGLTTLNGSLRLGSGNSFSSCIVSAETLDSGNTLRLTDSGGNVTDFSKATSVSGSWSGVTFNYSAKQNGVDVATGSTSVALDLYGSANIIGCNVKNGNTVLDSKGAQLVEDVSDKIVYCNLTGGSGSTIAQVSTSDTFDAGVAAGIPTGATLGSKVTGTVYNVSIARGGYSAVAKTIDVSSAYTDARAGYYTKAQYDANYTAGYNAGSSAGYSSGYDAGYDDGYDDGEDAGYRDGDAAGQKTGYNEALSDAGIPNGGTVYTGTWRGTLYVAPSVGALPVDNCVGGATGHRLSKK